MLCYRCPNHSANRSECIRKSEVCPRVLPIEMAEMRFKHTHATVMGLSTLMCKSITESSFTVFKSRSTVAQFLLFVTVALSKITLKFLCWLLMTTWSIIIHAVETQFLPKLRPKLTETREGRRLDSFALTLYRLNRIPAWNQMRTRNDLLYFIFTSLPLHWCRASSKYYLNSRFISRTVNSAERYWINSDIA